MLLRMNTSEKMIQDASKMEKNPKCEERVEKDKTKREERRRGKDKGKNIKEI
jgi:hypothetical protein